MGCRQALLQIPARIIGLAIAPLLHELLELIVDLFGQQNTHCCKQVARTAFCLEALALEAKRASGICARRNSQFHSAVERGNANLSTKYGFVKRDWQFEAQVGAIRFEQRMWRDIDRDQCIARPATCARPTLPFEPDL